MADNNLKTIKVDDEEVILKKDKLFKEWRVVYPIRNDDGKINLFRLFFGSKSNLAFLVILIIIGCLLFLGISEIRSPYQAIAENPCGFCKDCFDQSKVFWSITK